MTEFEYAPEPLRLHKSAVLKVLRDESIPIKERLACAPSWKGTLSELIERVEQGPEIVKTTGE